MKQKLLEEHTFGSKGCSGITTDFIFATNYVCIRRSRTHGRQVLIHEYLFLKIVASKPISEKSPTAFPECWLSQQALIYFIYYLAAPSTNRKQPKTFRYHTTKPIYIRLLIIILMLISF